VLSSISFYCAMKNALERHITTIMLLEALIQRINRGGRILGDPSTIVPATPPLTTPTTVVHDRTKWPQEKPPGIFKDQRILNYVDVCVGAARQSRGITFSVSSETWVVVAESVLMKPSFLVEVLPRQS
jgi:hypothetical protein